MCLINHNDVNAYGGVDVCLHAFLNSPGGRYDLSASRRDRFSFEEISPGNHSTGTGPQDLYPIA